MATLLGRSDYVYSAATATKLPVIHSPADGLLHFPGQLAYHPIPVHVRRLCKSIQYSPAPARVF